MFDDDFAYLPKKPETNTFRAKLKQEHPECVDEKYVGGCKGCPSDYGYEQFKIMCKNDASCSCKECWGRSIDEQNLYLPNSKYIHLGNAPVGFYLFNDKLLYKTFYTDMSIPRIIDVETGKYFKDKEAADTEINKIMVKPVSVRSETYALCSGVKSIYWYEDKVYFCKCLSCDSEFTVSSNASLYKVCPYCGKELRYMDDSVGDSK